jgi:hypothetical protein
MFAGCREKMKTRLVSFHIRVVPREIDDYGAGGFVVARKIEYNISYTNDGWTTTHTIIGATNFIYQQFSDAPEDTTIENKDTAIAFARTLRSFKQCLAHDSIVRQRYAEYKAYETRKADSTKRAADLAKKPINIY